MAWTLKTREKTRKEMEEMAKSMDNERLIHELIVNSQNLDNKYYEDRRKQVIRAIEVISDEILKRMEEKR